MHAPIRHPEHLARLLEPSELQLIHEALPTIVSRARAWTNVHRLIVLGAASNTHVEHLGHAVNAADVESIEHVRPETIEADLRRTTMQHVPRGNMLVLWLSSGMS